jgi:hypothetical protein
MHDTIFLFFLCLILLTGFLFLFVLHLLLFRSKEFFEFAFPQNKPTRSMLFSTDPSVSNQLVIYFSVRLLFWCVVALAALILAKRFFI